jgi:hypothetical protein
MVVNDPQNPTARRSEYFVSRFHATDNIEKTPHTKLPITLTANTFTGNEPINTGDDTILYLRNAPARAPNARRINSTPLIFFTHHFNFNW